MSEFEVAKEFNTVNRRFKVGGPIAESDDITPFTFEERRQRDFIKPKATPPDPIAAVVRPKNKLSGGAAAEPEPAAAGGK